MRHLKLYNKLYESTLPVNDCDFDEFKTVMFEITDQCYQYDFIDHGDYYIYECTFYLTNMFENIDDEQLDLSMNYLRGVLGDVDSPNVFTGSEDDNSYIYDMVSERIKSLEKSKKYIDRIIESHSKYSKIIKDIEEYIIPRFHSFTNFRRCELGIDDDGYMSLSFYIIN